MLIRRPYRRFRTIPARLLQFFSPAGPPDLLPHVYIAVSPGSRRVDSLSPTSRPVLGSPARAARAPPTGHQRGRRTRSPMRTPTRVAATVVAALTCLLGAFTPALAQTQTEGRFAGTVLDPSGSAVPGVTVLVRNERTGEERTVVSNQQGRYLASGLKPATYTIRASIQSFAPLEYTNLQINAGQELVLDLQLQTAGVTENIVVKGESTTIDISSARMGVNVSERDVQNLPVNGRQMSQLMLQAPGSVNTGTGTWQDVRFSGRAVEQNAIRYDGVEGSSIIDSAPGNLNGEIPTPFKLQASLE